MIRVVAAVNAVLVVGAVASSSRAQESATSSDRAQSHAPETAGAGARAQSRPSELGTVGGHTEFGVLPVAHEALSIALGLGIDFELAHRGPVYVGAGPSILIAVKTSQTDCGPHCPKGFGAAGGNLEAGVALGSWFVAARVGPLVGYANGYPGQDVSFWIHSLIVAGLGSGRVGFGVYCGYLAALAGIPSGFDPGFQFTSLF